MRNPWAAPRNAIATNASEAANAWERHGNKLTASQKDTGNGSGRIPDITLRTALMAMLVAMGGFIFGYDTGQISGYLEMSVFLERFGQRTTDLEAHPTGYYFTHVRNGLVVALVRLVPFHCSKRASHQAPDRTAFERALMIV